MLQLRRARECLGVCLQDWWPLLVPGAGSGDARCWGEKLDDEAVVVVFSCRVLLSATAVIRFQLLSQTTCQKYQQRHKTGMPTSIPWLCT